MSKDAIRAEIREIEKEIKALQDTPPLNMNTVQLLSELFDRKWALEKQAKQISLP